MNEVFLRRYYDFFNFKVFFVNFLKPLSLRNEFIKQKKRKFYLKMIF